MLLFFLHTAHPTSITTTRPALSFSLRQVTPADVQALERELLKRMDIIVAKKRKLALLRRGGAQQSAGSGGRLWGVLAGAASSVWSGGQSQSQLKQEIAAMEVRLCGRARVTTRGRQCWRQDNRLSVLGPLSRLERPVERCHTQYSYVM